MTELKILDLENNEKGKIKMPNQFDEVIRPDLIKRVVLAIMSHNRQEYGASPRAGKRASADISKRRHNYRGMYGFGISRVPRKIFSRRGTRMNWQGAIVPGTVGGRRAHPPKAEKIFWKKVNKKERKKAIRSAIAATINKEIVKNRGHKVIDSYPFVVDSSIENIDKAKKVKDILVKLGLQEELKRSEDKKIRAGKGKSRGRKYRKKKGVLIVVSKDCKLVKSSGNIPGMDICKVKDINAELLAPGAVPGRLTLWSKGAIEIMEKEKLFS